LLGGFIDGTASSSLRQMDVQTLRIRLPVWRERQSNLVAHGQLMVGHLQSPVIDGIEFPQGLEEIGLTMQEMATDDPRDAFQ